MKRQDIINNIHNNYDESKVYIGATFPSESALYSALGIPKDNNANKAIKKVVEQFFHWEKTNRLNQRGTISKEIKITWVHDDPLHFTPEDGRSNNGGAHNVVYSEILSRIIVNKYLLQEQQKTNKDKSFKDNRCQLTVTKAFFTFLHIDISDNEDAEDVSFKIDKYNSTLYKTLRNSTFSALDSLQNQGIISYVAPYKVVSFLPNSTLPEIDGSMSIKDLLRTTYSQLISEIGEEKVLNAFEKEYLFDLDDTVFDAAKWLYKKQRRERLKAKKEKGNDFDVKIPSASKVYFSLKEEENETVRVATDEEVARINTLRRSLASFYKYDPEKFMNRAAQRNKVYETINIIYRLAGFNSVRNEITITFNDGELDNMEPVIEPVEEQELIKEFYDVFEPRFARSVANIHDNLLERAEGRKGFGNRERARGTMPEGNVYYMAESKEVNLHHCKVFRLEEDEKYLMRYIENPNYDALINDHED